MPTIVIHNRKGGVGKTMSAVHLAWFVAEDGLRVLFVDLDGRGNGSAVLSAERQAYPAADLFEAKASREIDGEPGITVLSRDPRLHMIELAQVPTMLKAFATLKPHFDYCVVDTPPNRGARNFAAMAVCDFLLSPIELTDFAIEGVGQLLQSILSVQKKGGGAQDQRPWPPCLAVQQPLAPRANESEALVRKIGPKMMFPGVITSRGGYASPRSADVVVDGVDGVFDAARPDPDGVYRSVRAFARVELEQCPRAMALHVDEEHPHVHLTIAARGEGADAGVRGIHAPTSHSGS